MFEEKWSVLTCFADQTSAMQLQMTTDAAGPLSRHVCRNQTKTMPTPKLQPVAALVDNVNDDFAVAFSEAMELIVSQDEFQDIMKADPIGISSVAGVAETDAGSKAWICYM